MHIILPPPDDPSSTNNPMREFLKQVLPAILYSVLIFLVSSLSNPPAPDFNLEWGDKINHAGAFGLLMLLAFRAVRWFVPDRPLRTQLALAFLYCLLYGAIDEIHQTVVPNRHGDLLDLLADTVGATLGALFIVTTGRWPLGRWMFGLPQERSR